ncbi:MAG: T9SS type A sorting domain-containing protein [Candidatus Cloacimonetes bacterium]|nr:T9SS type A sorting domain-containing protein [Candidatus Cloacimonadota bacterium]
MEFNHIYSTINRDKAFVVCDKVPSDPKKILIANNYFGTMFDPFKNLIPTEIFIYDPVWEPDPATLNVSIIPAMYKTAKDYQRMSDYDSAQALWHQYYSAVSDSSILFDKTIKQLLSVEKLSSDNYTQLLAFYGTAATDDPISIRLLSYMSNYCLIEGNDLQSAILWLESQIENPVTEVDSLFAAIDIGYLYTIIDANKAPIHGKMPWLKPTSMQAYENNRNNAIMSLINGQSSAQPISQSSLPTASLLRNYPNPFNPSTTISFNLPSVMSCKLEIYNLKGQRVITLLNEARASGSHTITWSGLDDAGRPVSSGLYFYRLTTPQNIVSAKMLMLK